MMTQNLRSLTSALGYRLAVVLLAVGLAGCASLGGGASIPAVGTWAITVDSPVGLAEMTLTINADMSGAVSMTEPAEASFAISDAAVDGQSLSFSMEFEFQGQSIPATFQGTIDGDAITGEFMTDFGNAAVTGTRT